MAKEGPQLLITFENSVKPYYSGSENERLHYIKKIEREVSSLILLSNYAAPGRRLCVSISGLLLKLFADEIFKKEFAHYVTHGLKDKSTFQNFGWTHPLQALKALASADKISLAATGFSQFPLSLVQSFYGVQHQIKESLNVITDLFQTSQESFYYPYGNFVPGLDKWLHEEGLLYSFISNTAFNQREPNAGNTSLAFSPHGVVMVPYVSFNIDNNATFLNEEIPLKRVSSGDLESFIDSGFMQNKLFIETHYFHQLEKEKERLQSSHFPYTYNSMEIGQDLFPDWAAAHLAKSFKLEKEFDVLMQPDNALRAAEWSFFIDGLIDEEGKTSELFLESEKNVLNDRFRKNDSDKLNIVMLSWEFPPYIVGGLARHVYGLAKAMAKSGHHIHVLTAGGNAMNEYEILEGVHVHRVTPLNSEEGSFLNWVARLNMELTEKINEISRTGPIDIIHAHDWLVASAAISSQSILNIPLAATIHSTEYGRNNGIYSDLQTRIHEQEQSLINHANKLIVCSEYMKEELRKVFNLKDKEIVMLPNGITEEEVASEDQHDTSRYLPGNNNKPLIFSWGRIVQEKGFQTLIKSAVLLKNKGRSVHIVVSGQGPYLPYLKNLVVEEGVEDDFVFTGFINDHDRNGLLSKAELTVFPSLYEPFGIVALEAMAARKPIIVSKTGGLQSIIEHEISGLLFKPGDPQELADKIEYLLSNPEKAKIIAGRGKELALGLYSWSRIGIETERQFKDLMIQHSIKRGENYEKYHNANRERNKKSLS